MPSVSVEEFQAYVGTDESGDFVESCLSAGNAHVGRFIGDVDTVPAEIHRQAILICASELFHRRSSPQGVMQMAMTDGSAPVRVGLDPMRACYPILQPYVGWAV